MGFGEILLLRAFGRRAVSSAGTGWSHHGPHERTMRHVSSRVAAYRTSIGCWRLVSGSGSVLRLRADRGGGCR